MKYFCSFLLAQATKEIVVHALEIVQLHIDGIWEEKYPCITESAAGFAQNPEKAVVPFPPIHSVFYLILFFFFFSFNSLVLYCLLLKKLQTALLGEIRDAHSSLFDKAVGKLPRLCNAGAHIPLTNEAMTK